MNGANKVLAGKPPIEISGATNLPKDGTSFTVLSPSE